MNLSLQTVTFHVKFMAGSRGEDEAPRPGSQDMHAHNTCISSAPAPERSSPPLRQEPGMTKMDPRDLPSSVAPHRPHHGGRLGACLATNCTGCFTAWRATADKQHRIGHASEGLGGCGEGRESGDRRARGVNLGRISHWRSWWLGLDELSIDWCPRVARREYSERRFSRARRVSMPA